jgi:hypothetical protein
MTRQPIAAAEQRAQLEELLVPENIEFYCKLVREGRRAEAREFAQTQFNRLALTLLKPFGLTTPAGKRLTPAAVELVLTRIAAERTR